MEGLPTRSSEISPFFSSKQKWESQASNNSGGPAEGQTPTVSFLCLGKEHRDQRKHLSLDLKSKGSLTVIFKAILSKGKSQEGLGGFFQDLQKGPRSPISAATSSSACAVETAFFNVDPYRQRQWLCLCPPYAM